MKKKYKACKFGIDFAMVRRETECIGVPIPISHFTREMEYYPPALPFIVIDQKYRFPNLPQFPMSIEQSRTFIIKLLQKLNRRFFFLNDYVIDVTPERNVFAIPIKIDEEKIISLGYTNEEEYVLVPRTTVDKLLKSHDNDCVKRICDNTNKMINFNFSRKMKKV